MTHIISLKDGSYYRVSESEANSLFESWANKEEIIQIPRAIPTTHRDIKTVADTKSWLEAEKKRLKERNQYRCFNCLEVNRSGETCACKEKEKELWYEPGLGSQGIVDNLKRGGKEPTKDEIVKVVNLLRNNFKWAREWWENEKGRLSVCHYAKIVWQVGYFYLESTGTKKVLTR